MIAGRENETESIGPFVVHGLADAVHGLADASRQLIESAVTLWNKPVGLQCDFPLSFLVAPGVAIPPG